MTTYPIDKSKIEFHSSGLSRSEKAVTLFREGYNCSQAVAGAFSELFGMDESVILRLSASFGGGFGRMREVCGAFSGISIILGLFCGSSDGANSEAKAENYRLVQEASELFNEANGGSIICRELLGLSAPEGTHIPAQRTAEYYQKRPCVEIVSNASDILVELLQKYSSSNT